MRNERSARAVSKARVRGEARGASIEPDFVGSPIDLIGIRYQRSVGDGQAADIIEEIARDTSSIDRIFLRFGDPLSKRGTFIRLVDDNSSCHGEGRDAQPRESIMEIRV